jgi:hypothetical protein
VGAIWKREQDALEHLPQAEVVVTFYLAKELHLFHVGFAGEHTGADEVVSEHLHLVLPWLAAKLRDEQGERDT